MTETPDLKVVAFYLPQFHPVPENDRWWGKGFTEWRNVARSRPLFQGHYQPHLPAELGFYDLRVPEIRHQQVELARQYGVHGFCFYYYWFGGRRILERPLNEFLADRALQFPFCIMWANESWTRRWDGQDKEILLEQKHTEETDAAFLLDVLPLLKDPRYIRVDGAPLLSIYRCGLLPNPQATTRTWREVARQHGVPRLHLCAVESFGLSNPCQMGFDSGMEFPPHGVTVPQCTSKINSFTVPFDGFVFDYREAAECWAKRELPDYPLFRTVMTSWDNTPRRGAHGMLFINSTPRAFEAWLRAAVEQTRKQHSPSDRLVFVNAWNEWAESAHLEPDQRFGHQYLEAVQRIVSDRNAPSWETTLREISQEPPDYETAGLGEHPILPLHSQFFAIDRVRRLRSRGTVVLNRLTQSDAPICHELRASTTVHIEGCVEACSSGSAPLLLVLQKKRRGRRYFAHVSHCFSRTDVTKPDGMTSSANGTGFRASVSVSSVPAGQYRLGLVQQSRNCQKLYVAWHPQPLTIQTSLSLEVRPIPFLPAGSKRYRLVRALYRWLKRTFLPAGTARYQALRIAYRWARGLPQQ